MCSIDLEQKLLEINIYWYILTVKAGCDTRSFLRVEPHTHAYVHGPRIKIASASRPLSH